MNDEKDKPALARATDPATSHEAAASLKTGFLEKLVLDVIGTFPNGCIADEIEQALPGLRWNTITPRFRPLMKKGLIAATGERRAARSGRSQRVLKIAAPIHQQGETTWAKT